MRASRGLVLAALSGTSVRKPRTPLAPEKRDRREMTCQRLLAVDVLDQLVIDFSPASLDGS